MVATEAADTGNVTHLVYVSSFLPDVGEALSAFGDGTPAPYLDFSADGTFCVRRETAQELFLHDCDPDAVTGAFARLAWQSAAVLSQPVRWALTLTQGQGSSIGGVNTHTRHATRTAVAANGLRKAYGATVVLDGVDLRIGEGEVFALLGPNGAGKTTTVKILSTLIPADAGTASVLGHDLRGEAAMIRGLIGVTGQFSAVDNWLTGEENLMLMGRLLHLPAAERRARAARLLEQFDLVEAARRSPATYSGGMKRRLDIAMTLMGRPRLIFLDEPTTGLDPRSRHTTWQLIRDLVAEGVTILLTTQYLEEADQLADRIAVLDHGRIVAEGTPEQLKRRIPGAHIRLTFADTASLDAAARALREGTRDDQELALRVPHEGGVRSLQDVLARLGHGVAVEDLSIHTPDLDDVFFALTGHPSKEQTP
jgi:ABC-2 type transport system ATP-binding protein